MYNCSACDGDLMDMNGRFVCIRCFTVCEMIGKEIEPNKYSTDVDKSPNYKETDEQCF